MSSVLFTTNNLLVGAGALAVAAVGGSVLYTSIKKPPPDERAILADAAFAQADADANASNTDNASGETPGEMPGEGSATEIAASNPLCPEDLVEKARNEGWIEACGTGRPPAIPLNPFDGVWDVSSPGNPKIDSLIIYMHSRYGPLHRGDPNQPSPAHGVWRLLNVADFAPTTFSIPFVIEEDGFVTSRAGQFDYCNCGQVKWRVRPTGDPNMMVGEWRYGDESGDSVWRKRSGAGVIRSVSIHSAFSNEAGEWIDDQVEYGSRAGRLDRTYPVGCGAGMRGNCSSLYVTIFGENFAGAHDVWVDPATRLELNEATWVCKNGVNPGGSRWDECGMSNNPGDSVAGIRIKFYLWDGMKPGQINIWVDDQPIPVNLSLDGYPESETEQRPSLVLLDAQNSAGDQLTQVEEGEPFIVKAIFDDAHPDAWVSIDVPDLQTLPGEIANKRELILQRTQDPKIFQSDWLAVEAGEINPAL